MWGPFVAPFLLSIYPFFQPFHTRRSSGLTRRGHRQTTVQHYCDNEAGECRGDHLHTAGRNRGGERVQGAARHKPDACVIAVEAASTVVGRGADKLNVEMRGIEGEAGKLSSLSAGTIWRQRSSLA